MVKQLANKKITKNLLKDQTCENCRWGKSLTTSWCWIYSYRPSLDTCEYWEITRYAKNSFE